MKIENDEEEEDDEEKEEEKEKQTTYYTSDIISIYHIYKQSRNNILFHNEYQNEHYSLLL